ncbi:MAG: hypothetical protein LIO41_00485 [Ruminococcus sp.]|nr:hypothetical protein [Ruminococcus sp.]
MRQREADKEVKIPDVSSESEALTYEEAIEPFAASDEMITLQRKANGLYKRFECILHYYYGWGLFSFTDESGVTITTEDGITDDMNAISEYLDSCDQYVTAANEISNAMFRDAYISFSDASRELYDMLVERNGAFPTSEETLPETAAFIKLGIYNMVIQSVAIDEDFASLYLSNYIRSVENLFTLVEMYCRLYESDDIKEVEIEITEDEDDVQSGFYWRAYLILVDYMNMALDNYDASGIESGIDISYITSTLDYLLAYQPNIEAIGIEAYEGDSQKQAQLDDFFEQATKLYNTLVAFPPTFGDDSYIEKNEFDVDVIEELVKKINED